MDSPNPGEADLSAKVLPELQRIAEGLGVQGHQRLRKGDLIEAIMVKAAVATGARRGRPAGRRDHGEPHGRRAALIGTRRTAGREGHGGRARRGDGGPGGPTGGRGRGGHRGARGAGRPREGQRPAGPGKARPGRGANAPRQERRGRRMSREERPSPAGAAARPGARSARRTSQQPRPHRHSGRPARGVWVPPDLGLPPGTRGRLRVPVADPPLRPAARGPGQGKVRQPRDNEKYPALLRIETVNGVDPEMASLRPSSTS